MRKITISNNIASKLPNLALGCIQCDVSIMKDCPTLWEEIDATCKEIFSKTKLDQIASDGAIQASRQAYKKCGKDPARYRLSSEALMRRAVKGMELYRINNVVDLVNLISLQTGLSIGGFDESKIEGDIVFDIGLAGEPYQAIGRGELNIENLPVFRDDQTPFGSPTSDSVRTCVTDQTTRFLMIIIGFSGQEATRHAMNLATEVLTRYAEATKIELKLITSSLQNN